MLDLLLTVVIAALIVGLLLWIVEAAPFVSASIKPVARWVILAIAGVWFVVTLVHYLRGSGHAVGL